MRRYNTIIILLVLAVFPVKGQKMVFDSLVIDFGKIDKLYINAYVDTVIDVRNMQANCIGIAEKTKYVFVPVDNLVLTKNSLSYEISRMFLKKPDSTCNNRYRLEINEFVIGAKKEFFKTTYTCNAALSVYSLDTIFKPHYSGTLLYETNVSLMPKRKHPNLGPENTIDDWKLQFVEDMQRIKACLANDSFCPLPNFRREINASRKNMLVNTEILIGLKSWLVDGEIIFSRPEAQKEFSRQAYSLRYRNEKKFESFETSISNKQHNYRLSNSFLFILKSKTFFGFNRWNDNEYQKHGLEDIFLIDFSFSQHIVFNRFFKNGITLGLGVMEDVTYIYSENFVFKPYAVAQIGIKL